jgi:O-antigen/teichoic acid export membrane protein
LISKRFIKSSIIYTVAGAMPLASAIILLPFYILYLPTEVYGSFAICLALVAVIQIITSYSFDNSLYIHYHELKSDVGKLNSFISSAFIFMLGIGLVVILVLSAVGEFVLPLVFPESTLSFFPYGFMAIGIGVFQAIFKVHGNLLQTREKPEPFLWSNLVTFGVIAITTIVGLKLFPGTLIGPLGGRLVAAFGSSMWALIRVFNEFGFHFTSPWKNTSASFNIYSFIYQIQQWVINYVDRFVILVFMPTAAIATVGIYEFAIKCLAPVELLLNGLNASIYPQVIKLLNKQEGSKHSSHEINRYFYGQISVMMIIICIAIFSLPFLVEWFVKKSQYKEALAYIPYLAVLFILRTMRLYFVMPYNILKKIHRLTFLNFSVALFKVILMIVLIVKWHVIGVIVSSGLAYAIEMILLWGFLKQDYAIRFNPFKLIVGPFLILLIIIIIEPFLGGTYPTLVHFAYGIACSLLLWFAYRNELKLLNISKVFN